MEIRWLFNDEPPSMADAYQALHNMTHDLHLKMEGLSYTNPVRKSPLTLYAYRKTSAKENFLISAMTFDKR